MAFKIKIETPPLPKSLLQGVPERIIERERIRAVNESIEFLSLLMFDVSPFSIGTLGDAWLAGKDPARKVGRDIVGRAVAAGAGGVEALVWDEGTRRKNPFPPVRKSPAQSALNTWIRRTLAGDAKISRGGKMVKANLRKPSHIREIAFALSRAIKRRGLPNPNDPFGRKKGIFTKAFLAARAELERIQDRMAARIKVQLEA